MSVLTCLGGCRPKRTMSAFLSFFLDESFPNLSFQMKSKVTQRINSWSNFWEKLSVEGANLSFSFLLMKLVLASKSKLYICCQKYCSDWLHRVGWHEVAKVVGWGVSHSMHGNNDWVSSIIINVLRHGIFSKVVLSKYRNVHQFQKLKPLKSC